MPSSIHVWSVTHRVSMLSVDSKGRAVCTRARNHSKLIGSDEWPKRQRRLSLLRTPRVIPWIQCRTYGSTYCSRFLDRSTDRVSSQGEMSQGTIKGWVWRRPRRNQTAKELGQLYSLDSPTSLAWRNTRKGLGSLPFPLNMLSLSTGLARNNLIHIRLFQHSGPYFKTTEAYNSRGNPTVCCCR